MKKINKNTLIAAGVIIVLVIIGIIGYFFSVNKKVAAWEDKVYPEVYVYGVDIGGLNKDEVISVLNEKLPQLIMDKKLKVVVGDNSLELSYSELNPTYNTEDIANKALAYGKDEGLLSKESLIKGKDTINLDADISYDEEALLAFENKVLEEFNIEPKNADIVINSGNITVTPEVSGKTIDKEELHNKLIENINGDPSNEVELSFDLVEQEATIKSEDLNKITGVISSYSSKYSNTGDGRVKNMEIAAGIVNGTIVMPGEEDRKSVV